MRDIETTVFTGGTARTEPPPSISYRRLTILQPSANGRFTPANAAPAKVDGRREYLGVKPVVDRCAANANQRANLFHADDPIVGSHVTPSVVGVTCTVFGPGISTSVLGPVDDLEPTCVRKVLSERCSRRYFRQIWAAHAGIPALAALKDHLPPMQCMSGRGRELTTTAPSLSFLKSPSLTLVHSLRSIIGCQAFDHHSTFPSFALPPVRAWS